MDRIEQRILDLAKAKSAEIIDLGRTLWHNAELGFREYETAKIAARSLSQCGLKPKQGLAVTGLRADMVGSGNRGAKIAVIGELDALPIPTHPDVNPKTKAAHCCGHHTQMAGMLGAAMLLSDTEIRKSLDGEIGFIAVPAEEYVDITYKDKLIEQGTICFGSGKQEMVRLGVFDDFDVLLGCHSKPGDSVTLYNSSMNGFVSKRVVFFGHSVHASSHPHEGVDALNAALLAMHGVNLLRETFRDEDSVRVHGYIPNGGTAVNVIADTASLEFSIRAKTAKAITDASDKFDRAMRAGGVAMGCRVEINTIPGYLPLIPAKDTSIIREAMAQGAGDYPLAYEDADVHLTASSDFGDLSHLFPVLQFYTGGVSGTLHSADVRVTDENLAYVVTAKVFALSAYKLLKDNARLAHSISDGFSPVFTKDAYLEHLYSLRKQEQFKL